MLETTMTRVLSGAVLIAFAILVVWFAPALLFFGVAELLVALAVVEYLGLASGSLYRVPGVPSAAAAMLTCAAFARLAFGSFPGVPLDLVLMTAAVTLGALSLGSWQGGHDALGNVAASLFPSLYLGLPLGAMVAIRETRGREALFLL